MARSCSLITLVAMVGCARPVAYPTPPLRSAVRVAGATCLSTPDVEASVTSTLVSHDADRSGLTVDVIVTPVAGASTDVELRVVRPSGDVGLDRHYALADAECESAPQLFALAVDRWLTSFPEWAIPSPPPPRPPARWLEVLLGGAGNTIGVPLGVDGQLGVISDFGGRQDRFGGAGWVRSSISQRIGGGRFRQTALLVGATWRRQIGSWETLVELRGGAVRVNGIGLVQNDATWIPWWEVAVSGGRRFSWGSIGIGLAATALRDHAVTRDGLASQDIPLARLGIFGTFGLLKE